MLNSTVRLLLATKRIKIYSLFTFLSLASPRLASASRQRSIERWAGYA
jgi:hypothetical protein